MTDDVGRVVPPSECEESVLYIRESRLRQLEAMASEVQWLRAEYEALRPEVRAFAEVMERRLQANDYKGGWGDADVGYLIVRLYEEAVELRAALRAQGSAEEVAHEAADIGNFAMMIAARYGALRAALGEEG